VADLQLCVVAAAQPEVPAWTRNLLPCQQQKADKVLAQLLGKQHGSYPKPASDPGRGLVRFETKPKAPNRSTVNRRPTDMCLKVNMRVTGFVANCAVEDTNAHRLISYT
jgi:hypothetical protein